MGAEGTRRDGPGGVAGAGDEAPWSLDELLAADPWDPEVTAGVTPLEYFWTVPVTGDLDALWQRLSDTSRLNRALGIAEMQFEERDGKLYGTSSPGGLEHHWLEVPWNWVSGRTMSASRDYTSGFSTYARVRYDLVGDEGERHLHAYFGFVPRNWLYRLLIRLGMRSLEVDFMRVVGALDEGDDALVVEDAPVTLPPHTLSRINTLASELEDRDVDRDALDELLRLVRVGDDMDVHRLQVRKLAHAWNISERRLLHLFLHATRVGLLELSWDVICPHCRGARVEVSTLGAVPTKASCEPCALEFGTDGPNAIEITFRIHPSIRDVPKQMFCSAQTAERRHVKVQQVLRPGEEREVLTALAMGRYRLRTLTDPSAFAYLDVGMVDDSIDEMTNAGDGPLPWRASATPDAKRVEDAPTLQLVNDTDADVSYIVEDVNWADEALRPAQLFCFQGFRDLFSEEYIGADVHLAIGEQVILFTDIVGSTRLYLDRGDPQAFAAVRRHFTEVFAIVDRHEGAVVKTIGDATMAAFSDTVQAIAAAREIHRQFPADGSADIRLRISVNTGVCIAVNLNSGIDYFGNAVNLAAKLQLLAGAGDVVISDEAWRAPGVRAYIAREDLTFEAVPFDFEALSEPVTAHRLATVTEASGRRNA